MRKCPSCGNKALRLRNVFSVKYICNTCHAVCTISTRQKAIANVLVNLVPILGVVLGIIFQSGFVFILSALIITVAVYWLHQRAAELHVVGG
ncbi:hypothetical protein NBRC116494_02700 [Aurantivibrio plasticivorans]